MRIWVIIILACSLLFAGFTYVQNIKFDTTVSVSVAKGPFKRLTFKLIDYKVSMNDMQFKNDFWDTKLGKDLFNTLSSTLQTLIKAAHQYVSIELDVNYLGLIKKHYKIADVGGVFVLVTT